MKLALRTAILFVSLGLIAVLALALPRLVHSAPSSASTIWVSPKGNDTNCARGARSRPCATLAKACNVAQSGDVVRVENGNYARQRIAGCAKSSPGVRFVAQTRHRVFIGGSGLEVGSRSVHSTWLTFDGIDAETFAVIGPCESGCSSTGGDFPIGDPRRTNHITIDHMNVRAHGGTGEESPAYADQVDYFTFEHSQIGPVCCDADGMDIYPTVSHVTVDHVDIHDVASTCSNVPQGEWATCSGGSSPPGDNHIDCLQMVGGDTVTIANSELVNCDAGTLMNGINRQGYRNVTLVNNFFQGHVLDMTGGGGVDSKGTYAFSGFVHIYYNTIPDGSYFQDWAPGGDYEIVGNIFGDIPPNHGKCTIEGTEGNPDVRFRVAQYNMFGGGARSCGPTNVNGDARFVNDKNRAAGIDLHLRADSPGLGRGSPALHPRRDIDGHLRPLRLPPDVGASQRESASIVLGHSIGAVAIGGTRARTEAFYGGHPRAASSHAHGLLVETESYRRHGGRLEVTYDSAGRVVGISTSSRYYTTSTGLGSGESAPKLSGKPARTARGCRNLRPWRRVRGTDIYLELSHDRIAGITMRLRRYDSCAHR
jgi:hypothetical protein